MKIPPYLRFSSAPQLPVINQAESTECGLACLAMIASYYGHDVDLNGLRQRFQTSLSGVNLRHIMQMAHELSFTSRALRLEMAALPKLRCPAILHWGGDHFVVLRAFTKSHALIHDPARGALKLPHSEVSTYFTGIALEFAPAADFKPTQARRVVKMSDLWHKLHGLPTAVAQILALSIAFQLITFLLPLQLQWVVDEAIANSDREILLIIAISFLALAALQTITEAMRAWLLQLLGQQFVFQVIGNLVRHLLRLPISFFEKRHLGDILSRMQSTRVIQDVLTRGLISAFIDGVMAVVAGALLFYYAPKLAAIVVASLFLIALINLFCAPILLRKTEDYLASSAKEQSVLMETIRAISTIKLLGRETEREGVWRNSLVKATNIALQLSKIQVSLSFVQNFVLSSQFVVTVYLGAAMIIDATGFSVGMLLAFLSFRQTFSDRAASLILQINQFRMLRVHVDRLGDIVAQSPEVHDSFVPIVPVSGAIKAKGVGFRYGLTDPFVFRNLNLEICPGQFIAITGPSGGGKSTLLKLLLGQYSPSEGEIELDGIKASPELWRSWREKVGIVTQDDKLLSGSVADNIAFFDPDLDMAKVILAATNARIHDEIVAKPMQYQTLIGDMGAALSGGQRQRLLLARALYRRPQILLLDEGTANLDPENEERIADYLASLEITKIVVAHRPALVERADRVLSLVGGELVEISPSKVDKILRAGTFSDA